MAEVRTSNADVVKMWSSVELWEQLCVCVCVRCVNNKCDLVPLSLMASLLPVLLWKTSLLTFLPLPSFSSPILSLPLKIPPSAPHPPPCLSSHFCPQSGFCTTVPLSNSLNSHPFPALRLLTCLSLSLCLSPSALVTFYHVNFPHSFQNITLRSLDDYNMILTMTLTKLHKAILMSAESFLNSTQIQTVCWVCLLEPLKPLCLFSLSSRALIMWSTAETV